MTKRSRRPDTPVSGEDPREGENRADTVIFREEPLPTDTESVREVVESSGFFYPAEIEVARELILERLSKGTQSGYYFLFAERGEKVVGYTCFGPIPCTLESFDLYWIAVHQSLRGSGIGRDLLLRTEKIIRGMGGTRIYVETSSRDQYRPTNAFYRACGYRKEATLQDFYGPGDGKVIFVKILP